MVGKEKVCNYESPAIVTETETLFNILNKFSHNHYLNYAVKKQKDDSLAGIISLEHLKEVMQIGDFAENMLAIDVMDKAEITCKPSTTLQEAYKIFDENDLDAIPIIDSEGRTLGILEKTTIDHYLHTRIIALSRKVEELDD